MDENVRANEVEEIETEVAETSDSYVGTLLVGFIGTIIAYAAIGGAKKVRAIIKKKLAAKKLAEATGKSVEVPKPKDEAPEESDDENETEA